MLNKNYIIVLVFCAFSFVKAQNTFNLNYTSGNMSAALGVRELGSDKYFVNSIFVDSTAGQQGLDMKLLDGQGAVIKRKRYLFDNIDFLTYLNNAFQYSLSESTELISAGSYSGSTSVVILASVNKTTLDTNWKKFYFDGVYYYNLNSVFKTKPNEFWFFGKRSSSVSTPCALKIDSLGNILSVKDFTNLTKYDVRSSYYDPVSNQIYFGGKNNNPTIPIECMVCMDTLGNILWNQQNYGQITFGQIEKKNNYLVVVGSVYAGDFAPPSTINPTFKLNVLKINATNGAVIWQKPYGPRRSTNYLTSLVINADESIVSTGCFYYPTLMYNIISDGIMLKVNSAGDSLWSQTYSNFNVNVQEVFYDIKKAQDGGYIMCGVPFYAPDPSSQSWVVKTDSLGIAPGLSTKINQLTNNFSSIGIYPNPVKEKLNIEIDISFNEQVKIRVFNNLGQMVLEEEKKSFDKDSELNVTDLRNGPYILQIITASGNFTGKFIVER